MQDKTPDPTTLAHDDDDGYSLTDLCDRTGVSARTVRYYIQQGLLPAAPRSGPGARYAASTLQRLQFIRACQEEGWPLARIRDDLEQLTPDDLDVALRPQRVAASQPPLIQATNPALDYLARLRGGAPPAPAPQPQTPSARPSPPTPPPEPPQQTPPGLTRTTWERIAIDPNIELHVRRPLSVADNRRLDKLLESIENIYKSKSTPFD